MRITSDNRQYEWPKQDKHLYWVEERKEWMSVVSMSRLPEAQVTSQQIRTRIARLKAYHGANHTIWECITSPPQEHKAGAGGPPKPERTQGFYEFLSILNNMPIGSLHHKVR